MEKRAFGIVALLGLFLMSLSSLADSKDKNVRGVMLMGKELKYKFLMWESKQSFRSEIK